jgi:hypothetical protein
MSNSIKISLTFCFIFLIYFPTKSNHINTENYFSIVEESTIEFEITKFGIEEDQFEHEKLGLVKTIKFTLEFKAKRNGVLLPCKYSMCFYASSKKVQCSQYSMSAPMSCSWSSESGLPPLDKIETKLRPIENTKAGKILVQKMKEKGFTTLSQECLEIITKSSSGCLKFG